MQNKYRKENPHISSLDKSSGITEFFIHELELNYEKVSVRFGVDPQELLEKRPRLNEAWSLLALCQSQNKSGMFAPATDGGPGNYGNQRCREEGVGAANAPATDGGPGHYGNQRCREEGVGAANAPATDEGPGNYGNQCQRDSGVGAIYAPATDGGPGNYGNQCQRDSGVGPAYAPATDGGPGNLGHQRRQEKRKNQNYTNDSLDRSMRGYGRRDGCAYLCNGEDCYKCSIIRVNDHYWCCCGHASCFKEWAESKKNEYN
jgi:hypothetical protein